MMTFQFDYQPVLEHRLNLEDIAQRELAKLLRERMVLDNQQQSLEQTAANERQQLAAALPATDGARLGRHAAYSQHIAVRLRQIAARIESLDRRIAAARKSYDEALKRRRAIERLHDKRYKLWSTRQHDREEADLHDAAAACQAMRV